MSRGTEAGEGHKERKDVLKTETDLLWITNEENTALPSVCVAVRNVQGGVQYVFKPNCTTFQKDSGENIFDSVIKAIGLYVSWEKTGAGQETDPPHGEICPMTLNVYRTSPHKARSRNMQVQETHFCPGTETQQLITGSWPLTFKTPQIKSHEPIPFWVIGLETSRWFDSKWWIVLVWTGNTVMWPITGSASSDCRDRKTERERLVHFWLHSEVFRTSLTSICWTLKRTFCWLERQPLLNTDLPPPPQPEGLHHHNTPEVGIDM